MNYQCWKCGLVVPSDVNDDRPVAKQGTCPNSRCQGELRTVVEPQSRGLYWLTFVKLYHSDVV